MDKDDTSKSQSGLRQSALVRYFKLLGLVGPLLFAVAWMAFGIFAFFLIRAWGIQYDRRMAMIERGEIKPEMLHVMSISKDEDRGWSIALGNGDKPIEWRSDNKIDDISVGGKVAAYRFGDKYLIPQFDRGGFNWGKWVFLGVGLLPIPVIGGVVLFKRLRARKRYLAAGAVTEVAPRRGSSGALLIPKAFSRSSISFDSVPDDAQLVCLLGDRDWGPVKEAEEGGLLTVRPWLFPMKFVAPWMVFTLVVGTAATIYVHHPLDAALWWFLAFGWLLCLPATLALMIAINRSLAKKGDLFKVDSARRTLELCRAGRTIKADEIVAFTMLTRWYRDASGTWDERNQTSVLVRLPNHRFELYPVVRGSSQNWQLRKLTWADRLANIFQVPVRRIELNRSESRELNDC